MSGRPTSPLSISCRDHRSGARKEAGRVGPVRHLRSRRLLFNVIGYVVMWSAFFLLIRMLESTDRELGDELAQHGVVVTVATVTSRDPGNHNSICFTYQVSGTTYPGCGSADFDKDASQLPPGSQMHITYDSNT